MSINEDIVRAAFNIIERLVPVRTHSYQPVLIVYCTITCLEGYIFHMFYAMLSRKRRYVEKIVQRLKLTAIKQTIPKNSTKSQEMLRVFKSIRLGNHAKQRYSKCDLDSRQP